MAILLTVFIVCNTYSQVSNGVYLTQSNDSLIVFNDSLLRFNMDYGCCILFKYYSFGILKKMGEYHVVVTEDSDYYEGPHFKVHSKLADTNTIELKFVDKTGREVYVPTIVILDRQGWEIFEKALSDDILTIEVTNEMDIMEASLLGHRSFQIPIDSVKDRRVDCVIKEGSEVRDINLRLSRIENDTIILKDMVLKGYKSTRKKRILV